MPKIYDNIASVIENTKYLETIDAQDVVSILKGYEQRLNRHNEGNAENAFASLEISEPANKFGGQFSNVKFQRNTKFKGKQWSNKVTAHVKQWQGASGTKPFKICENLHMVSAGKRKSLSVIGATDLVTLKGL